jgi:ATP-dependent Clp protease ATP-binding subunit ClpC
MNFVATDLREQLAGEIQGQDEAIEVLVRAVLVADLGICDPQRPLGSFLFVGPTGVGKSQLGSSLAKVLHGDENKIVRVNCTEFQNPHDVAKMVGAPPGYIGHEHPPRLTPEKLQDKLTVVIFEELEKADRNFYDLLLEVLEKGNLKTGLGVDLNFSNCFMIMTSNLGTREADRARRGSIGFQAPSAVITPEDVDAIKKAATAESQEKALYQGAVEDYFSPEFINRLDDIVIFHRLGHEHLLKILEKFLLETRVRCALVGLGTIFTDEAKSFLIRAGTNLRYGARPLRRAVRDYVEFPIANLVSSGPVKEHAVIEVDYSSLLDQLTFEYKKMYRTMMA